MLLRDQLVAFENAVSAFSPESAPAFAPPADGAAFTRLEEALSPYGVPDQVRVLYEWHDGASLTAFSGRTFLSIDQLLRVRQDYVDDRMEPESWLPLFLDAGGGRLFVEATPVRHVGERSVWIKGKDFGPDFEYTDLSAMFRVLTASFDEGQVELVEFAGGRSAFNATDNALFEGLRARMDPAPEVAQRHRSFFAAMDWPASWLAAMGVNKESSTLDGGPTTDIAEVISAGAAETRTFTIGGRVVDNGCWTGFSWLTVRDGTDEAFVFFDAEPPRLLENVVRGQVEVDIEVGPKTIPPEAYTPSKHRGHPVRGHVLRLEGPLAPSA